MPIEICAVSITDSGAGAIIVKGTEPLETVQAIRSQIPALGKIITNWALWARWCARERAAIYIQWTEKIRNKVNIIPDP